MPDTHSDTIELQEDPKNHTAKRGQVISVTSTDGRDRTMSQVAREQSETPAVSPLKQEEDQHGVLGGKQEYTATDLRFQEEGSGKTFKIQVVDVMETIRRILKGEPKVEVIPKIPQFKKKVTQAISMGDVYSRVMDRNDNGLIEAHEIDDRNWILTSTEGDYIRPWSLLQRYVNELEERHSNVAEERLDPVDSVVSSNKRSYPIASVSSPRRSLEAHEIENHVESFQFSEDQDLSLDPKSSSLQVDSAVEDDESDKDDIQLTFLKIPRVKGSSVGPRKLEEVATLTGVFNFFCRVVWFWSFISWFAISFCTAASATVEILLSCYQVSQDDYNPATKVCYFIGAVYLLLNFMFLFVIYLGTLFELIKAFSMRKFELNRVFMYFPKYIDFIEEAGNRYRYYIMVCVLLMSVLVSIVAERVDEGYTDNLEGGLLSTYFSYATTVFLGGGVSFIYLSALIVTDIYSIYMGLVNGKYLDETLQWLKYEDNCRYRNWWFISTRTIPPDDATLRNPQTWQDKLRFVRWLLARSYVPYQLASPIFLVSVMAAVDIGTWAYPMAIFIPWLAFVTHVLRHWRTEVLKFRAGQLIDPNGNEIPVQIGKSDEVRHNQKRTFRLRCCYVGTFILGALCLMMYAAILFSNRDSFAVDFRDKVYPLCQLGFTNPNLTESDMRVNLDAMDSIVIADTVYLEDANLTRHQLQKYFGKDSFCLDAANCADNKWRMVHHSYEEHPIWYHLHHPSSRTHVISVRGTWDFNDFMQDMVLFAEIISLQVIGIFIPIFNIWSHSLISSIVDKASVWSGAIYPGANKAYYEDPYEYLKNSSIPNDENEYLVLMGHSLGGGVAQVIAAKLFDEGHRNVISFSLSAPGVLYSSKKFDFSVEGLAYTSINALGERDPFTYIDRHLGLLTKFECNRELAVDCHSAYQSMCEVAGSCWNRDSVDIGVVKSSKYNYVTSECRNPTNAG